MAYLNRWDPFTEIARLQDEMSRQFLQPEQRSAGVRPWTSTKTRTPST